jgi:hypothetical protein
MLRLAALAFLIIALIPARANLGDTVADCVKRYGKPDHFTEANDKTPFGTIVFSAGPYEMVVFLYDNVEVGARVTKKDKTDFAPGELKTIMDADATSPWVAKPGSDPLSQEWIRADNASATYDLEKKMLIFTTPEMVKELHAPTPVLSLPETNAAPVPPRPPGNFVPAAPTQWAPPQPPSTNAAPATNAP